MKFLKILLIIGLLLVMCSGISLGTGIIESGDKTIDLTDTYWTLKEEPEEKSILNDWFKDLPAMEKLTLYTYWHGLNHDRSEFDDRLMWLEERVKQIEKQLASQIKLPDNKIDSWEELEIFLTDLCIFTGYNKNLIEKGVNNE